MFQKSTSHNKKQKLCTKNTSFLRFIIRTIRREVCYLKNVKKTIISSALVVVLLLSLAFSANAAYRRPRMSSSLEFSGPSAICGAYVSDLGKAISVSMQLWQGSSLLGSWSDSGTSTVSLSESMNVSSGQTYTLVVYGTINGVSFEMTPLTRSY